LLCTELLVIVLLPENRDVSLCLLVGEYISDPTILPVPLNNLLLLNLLDTKIMLLTKVAVLPNNKLLLKKGVSNGSLLVYPSDAVKQRLPLKPPLAL
jgi:hypothetical protein